MAEKGDNGFNQRDSLHPPPHSKEWIWVELNSDKDHVTPLVIMETIHSFKVELWSFTTDN